MEPKKFDVKETADKMLKELLSIPDVRDQNDVWCIFRALLIQYRERELQNKMNDASVLKEQIEFLNESTSRLVAGSYQPAPSPQVDSAGMYK